ncbi:MULTISPECIES: hypothetical protein [unclassified Symbiopectobacterium]|uniref:hypothetical protein n=1 Tax=unclassified Symbiopectobacterium TaxID=2794573 RepID=UPI0022273653|nr:MULTISPECIES: hypothetical protein [unclassified Symbiopectobacterium]MCW2477713.1 hypothetical protein [Candidatus Symbiopectobacterium sp. NZEC135]MCW2488871.1 hypothetical protein [Candidatus Symbiopectobacterium sp. NZEC127]
MSKETDIPEFLGTNGPWVASKSDRSIGPVCKDDDQSYGMILPVAWVEFDLDHKCQRANADLISAAPEMLKALQFIQPWIPTQDEEAVKLVDSAIKKALGGESE